MTTTDELIRLRAVDAVSLLQRGEVSSSMLLDAALDRIAAVDKLVNATPILCVGRARECADRWSDGKRDSVLAGLPILIKDLDDVEGVRTTQGSPIYADHIAVESDLFVANLEQNGAVIVGKTNTPEFGAGGNTFNEVFGPTNNPWDRRKTAGGSSGGSAAALATGQAWLASGSDMGGSLRTPAAYCSVVGFRPSPGRIPRRSGEPFGTLSVKGPMGRCVEDAALMMDAMAGQSIEDPLSRARPAQSFLKSCRTPPGNLRIAWSPDLGIGPVDAEVADICAGAVQAVASRIGADLVDDLPDFSQTHFIFQTERALSFAQGHSTEYADHRDQLKPEIIWNIEQGLALTPAAIVQAGQARGQLLAAVGRFFSNHQIIATPTTIAPPYNIEDRYLDRLGSHRFETYIDWLAPVYALTCAALPTISIPAGFTARGLPVGLQLAGPPHGDQTVLAAARLFEEALALPVHTPMTPSSDGTNPSPFRPSIG